MSRPDEAIPPEPGRYELAVDLTISGNEVAMPTILGPLWIAGTAFTIEEIEEAVHLDRLLAGTGHSTTYEGKPVTGTGTLAALLLGEATLADFSRAELLHAYATLKGCLGVFGDEGSFRGIDLRKMRSLIKKTRPLIIAELEGRRG